MHGAEIVINRKSTTWRGLDEVNVALTIGSTQAHPDTAETPGIVAEGNSHVGWNKSVQAQFGL